MLKFERYVQQRCKQNLITKKNPFNAFMFHLCTVACPNNFLIEPFLFFLPFFAQKLSVAQKIWTKSKKMSARSAFKQKLKKQKKPAKTLDQIVDVQQSGCLITATIKDPMALPPIIPSEKLSILEAFLYPAKPDDFLQRVYKKLAFATVCSSDKITRRIQRFNEEFACGLDLQTMLEETPSDNIFVWMVTKDDTGAKSIESFEVQDAKAAMVCQRAGASLYFRANPLMEDTFARALSMDLGYNFAGFFADTGKQKGEIETVCFLLFFFWFFL